MAVLKWIWSDKMPDWKEKDPECVRRALGQDWYKPPKLEKGIEIVIKSIDATKGKAEMYDANKAENAVHVTTLRTCSCDAYKYREKLGRGPCKHMVLLAMKLGLLNENGCTPEEQLEADLQDTEARLAIAAGYYHVIHKPLIKDEEYDQLKACYFELLNLSGETVEPVNITKPAENVEEKGIDASVAPAQSGAIEGSFGVAEAIFYLKSRNLEYIDKTPAGGALWFFDLNAARDFKANGIKVNYSATGSRSNGKRPGWYIRSDRK